MIDKIELWLNIVHYCLYKVELKRYTLSNRLNPFMLLGKIPAAKRRFAEKGTTHKEVVDKIWTDKRLGFGVMISGGAVVIFIFLIALATFDIANYYLGYPIKHSSLPFLICLILAYALCHLMIFQKDKYVKYFRELDKRSRSEKWRYALFTLLFVIVSVALWLYSFRFIPKI